MVSFRVKLGILPGRIHAPCLMVHQVIEHPLELEDSDSTTGKYTLTKISNKSQFEKSQMTTTHVLDLPLIRQGSFCEWHLSL